MESMIPLSDASRMSVSVPVITILIIVVNAFVFVLELAGSIERRFGSAMISNTDSTLLVYSTEHMRIKA
jgi:hypothetical protein